MEAHGVVGAVGGGSSGGGRGCDVSGPGAREGAGVMDGGGASAAVVARVVYESRRAQQARFVLARSRRTCRSERLVAQVADPSAWVAQRPQHAHGIVHSMHCVRHVHNTYRKPEHAHSTRTARAQHGTTAPHSMCTARHSM